MTTTANARPDRSLYQAIWRWHFIAGLIVMPLLVMMATTGGLYLFKDEITHLVYRKYIDVSARTAPMAPPSLVIRRTEAALHGQVLQITPPGRPDRSVAMIVRAPNGDALTVYADPYDGQLLGATPYGGVMQLVRKIHSLQRFGFWASCLIEIAAGWAIIMVGTGFYMWWPKGGKSVRSGGVLTVRGEPRERVFWRDMHAVTGAVVGLLIVFLAATGMPWSLFWGVKMQTWVGMHQLYAPRAPAYTQREEMMGMKAAPLPPGPAAQAVASERPWTMEKAPAPASASPSMPGMPGMEAMPGMPGMEAMPDTPRAPMVAPQPIGVDKALDIFRSMGVKGAFGLALPMGPKSAYVANDRPMKARDARTIYIDQYSGKVLGDVRYKDYYAGGKYIEWGSSVHMGREYRPWNRWLMLIGCISIIVLAISSLTMWWKRRPKGKLGLPAAPANPDVARGLLWVMIPVGVVFPLVGVSMIAAFIIEVIIGWRRRATFAH